MIVQSLRLSNFRNIVSMETSFGETTNIFYGNNGSGKTNLLEALFVLCLGRSFRGAADTVLVNDSADVYRLEADVWCDDKQLELATAYQRGGRKKITIDKLPVKLSELYDSFCAVAASPEDSELLSGPPSSRRQFLDIYLSQYSPAYLHTLSNYQKVLAQKNAALKNRTDPGPYNELLIDVGSELIISRARFIERCAEVAGIRYEAVSDGGKFRIRYKPSIEKTDEAGSKDAVAELFAKQVYDFRAKEEIMERSLIGPHRDEVYFEISGFPARSHGSQGEWRTAALALKLAVYALLKEKREIEPILLLDEIFAELDMDRCRGLADLFSDFKQIFITTAVTPPNFLNNNSSRFKIVNGEISEINS